MKVSPKRPYLLRAFYEWIVDNNMTPHVLVDARSPQVSVPRQFVKDGSIVLNVSMTAAHNLMMKDNEVTFSARFNGKAFSIYLPMWSVMAIYSRETQEGISFPPDEYEEFAALEDQTDGHVTEPPFLAAVPVVDEEAPQVDEAGETDDLMPEQQDDNGTESPKPGNKQRPPFLRVVK